MVNMVMLPLVRRKRMVRRFVRAGAIDRDHAVRPRDIRVNQALLFSRLLAKGIVVAVGDGRYYVDQGKF